MKAIEIKGGFRVPEGDLMGSWCMETGRLDHDRFLTPLCCQQFYPGACVMDVGAYIGDHTVAYSEKAGERGLVIAIEPQPEVYKLLEHNLTLFPFKNVFAFNMAAGAKPGSAKPIFEESNLGATYLAEIAEGWQGLDRTGRVAVVPLDEILRSATARKVDFIKLDVEGSEYDALLGADNILRNHRPKMVIEINRGALERRGTSFDKILKLFDFYTYTWKNLTPGNAEQFDILAWPKV